MGPIIYHNMRYLEKKVTHKSTIMNNRRKGLKDSIFRNQGPPLNIGLMPP